jgi:hypothetical protein
MKKPTNQVRPNRATSAAPAQVKISAANPVAEPGIEDGSYTGFQPVCLTIFDHRRDADLAGCDITPAKFEAIKRRAKADGVPISALFQQAVDALAAEKSPAEHSGNVATSDFWLKIPFSCEELEALQQIAGRIEPSENRTVENAVIFIVDSALVHWDKAEPLLIADQKYSNDEGFASLQHFHTQTIAAKFKRKRARRRVR